MLHRLSRGLGAILAAALIASALPWAYAQNAPVSPGASLAGIPLGAPIPEVVRRLGSPSAVRLVGQDGTLAYAFRQYGITVYVRDNVVVAVSTTNSVLGTVRGIPMGASQDAVIAAFGRPRTAGIVEGFPGILYDSLGLAFGFDRHSVAVVIIFPPRGAASPGAPSPQGAPPVTTQAPQDGVPISAAATPAPGEAGTASLPAVAVQGAAGGIPDVSRLRPYTAETHFLSLAGYLRYLIYGVTRQWVGASGTVQQLLRPAEEMTVPQGAPTPAGTPVP